MAQKTPRRKSASSAQTSSPDGDLTRESPLVFISHDTRDGDLAEAFGNLLTDASGGFLQSFRSSDRKGTSGIEFGAEWYGAIMSKLDSATDVVALLTPHSLDRPWILYETGVAKGKLDATVLGLALGIPLEGANSGPFAQFQNCADDEDSLTKLVLQLIRRNPTAQPREEAVRRQVQAFQASVKSIVEKRPKRPVPPAKVDENAVAKMFEEVKALVRGLPEKVGSRFEDGASGRKRRFMRFPLIAEDCLDHFLRDGEEQAIAYTLIFSMFRDEAPWFYELGMRLANAIEDGEVRQTRRAHRALVLGTKMALHGPLAHMHRMERDDGPELDFVIRRVVDFVEHVGPPRRLARSSPSDPVKDAG